MFLFALQIRQKRIFLGQLSKEVQFLKVTLNNELNFHNHVSNIYLKANRKLSALSKQQNLLPLIKDAHCLRVLQNVSSKYCSLIWNL